MVCDWIDNKNYLIHYRLLEFYIRHGIVVEKVHEIISCRQSRWLEKSLNFNTQKWNRALKKTSINCMEMLSLGKS